MPSKSSKAPAPTRLVAPQGAEPNYTKSSAAEPGSPPQQTKPTQREALGRSRGGLSTKVHLAADSRSRPLGFITTLGQRHDSVAFELTLAQVAVARIGPGRPRTRPDAVLCDKAYSSKAIRAHLARRKIKAVIAVKDDQHAARLNLAPTPNGRVTPRTLGHHHKGTMKPTGRVTGQRVGFVALHVVFIVERLPSGLKIDDQAGPPATTGRRRDVGSG